MRKQALWFGWGLFFFLILINWPANIFDLSTVKITISAGSSASEAQKILIDKKILPAFSPFRALLVASGQQSRIKAGEYLFSPADPLYFVIFKLVRGQVVPPEEIKATFPEGTSIYKMGMILKAAGFNNWREFQNLVNEGLTAPCRERHWGIFKYIPSESLEGYLFPDTYQFTKDAPVEVMVEVMLKRFESKVAANWQEWQKKTKLSLHEIITLASIVEKEAKQPEERPVIASVFYNRLAAGIPLAADPTVKYSLENPTKRVYLNQLEVNSLYNTYKRKGLPPGPICNPGLDSIKAVIFPAKTDYYFFVAKKDGSHVFSRTWQEHQRARQRVVIPIQSLPAV